jgi:hypothetical protein
MPSEEDGPMALFPAPAPQEEPPYFTEAPFEMYVPVYKNVQGQVVQINARIRANNAPQGVAAFEQAIVAWAGIGYTLLRPDYAPVPLPTSPEPAAPGVQVPLPPKAPYTDIFTKVPGTENLWVFHATKLVVKPEVSGKVRLEWWREGRQFCDVYCVRDLERQQTLMSILPGAQEIKWGTPGAYTLHHIVRFSYSTKTSGSGKPYKDVVDILPEP